MTYIHETQFANDTIKRVSAATETWLTERGSPWELVQEGDLHDPRVLGASVDGVPVSISFNVTP